MDLGLLRASSDYRRNGNVEALTDTRGGGYSQGFVYDSLDRLTTVSGMAAGTFTYDDLGNRLSKNGNAYTYSGPFLMSDGVQSFTYDSGNTIAAGPSAFEYTPYNMLAKATTSGVSTNYRYDADNQRRMRIAGDTTEFFVPGPGLVPLAEYKQVTGAPSPTLVREYIYVGGQLIASEGLTPVPMAAVTFTDDPLVAGSTTIKASHLAELRAAIDVARAAVGLSPASWTDVVTAGTTLIKPVHVAEMRTALAAVYMAAGGTPPTYTDPTLSTDLTALKAVHLQELRAAIKALPTLPVVAKAFYHLDALGTVRAVTNATGAVVRRHDYAPFGEEVAPVIGADARRFTGKERDQETGLDYFSARYYYGQLGRFSNVDPISVTAARLMNPHRLNRFAYAINNPLRFIDPAGLDVITYNDSGKEMERQKQSKWHNFWFGDTYRISTPKGMFNIADALKPLANGAKYTVVGGAETSQLLGAFLSAQTAGSAGQSLSFTEIAQRATNEWNWKVSLNDEFGPNALFMLNGLGQRSDYLGNFAFGYLMNAWNPWGPNTALAKWGGAAFNLYDSFSTGASPFKGSIFSGYDDPRDFAAINAGAAWYRRWR